MTQTINHLQKSIIDLTVKVKALCEDDAEWFSICGMLVSETPERKYLVLSAQYRMLSGRTVQVDERMTENGMIPVYDYGTGYDAEIPY